MTTIEIRQRRDDVHAQIKGMPTHWGCGRTEAEAIGDLIKSHSHSFNFEVGTIKQIYSMTPKEFVGFWVLKNKKFLEIEIKRM